MSDFKHNYNDVFNWHQYKLFLEKHPNHGLERSLNDELIKLYTTQKSTYHKIDDVNDITYVNCIFPKVKMMLLHIVDIRMLRRRAEKLTLLDNYPTIYLEAVAYIIAFGDRITLDIINPTTLCYVFSFYPNLLFNILYIRTITEQQEIFKGIESKLNEMTKIPPILLKNIEILKDYWKNRESYKHNYNYFNNFNGIRFDAVKQPYEALPKGNRLIINLGYNYDKTSYVYSRIKTITEEFATDDNISNFKTFENIKILNRKERYKLEKRIEDRGYFIILNYCNDANDEKCLYSINTQKAFSEHEIKIILNGGIIYPYSKRAFALYFAENFEDRLKFMYYSTNYKIMGIISKIRNNYDQDLNICINNWSKISKNDNLLKIYLENLTTCIINGKLNKDLYEEAMKEYYLIP